MILEEKIYSNAITGEEPEVLHHIQNKENSIAIYERSVDHLQGELSDAADLDFTFKTSGDLESVSRDLNDFFKEKLPNRPCLKEDVLSQIRLFLNITKEDSCRLLFSTVSSNMCRKFHTDINDLRLLCTYQGQGTLWVCESEESRVSDPDRIHRDQIHQVDTGDVLILKGALHPEGNPILHRSPTIEKMKEKRLLLRIDTNNVLQF